MTLRDIWQSKNMNSVEVAAKAKCSVATLYKLNRREDDGVAVATIRRVCNVLGLSLAEYESLDACPMADRYK